jgi:hypothetical protein
MKQTLRSQQARPLLAFVAVWDLAWRFIAIRRALQRRELKWAAALLVISSAGVLPIVYMRRTGVS